MSLQNSSTLQQCISAVHPKFVECKPWSRTTDKQSGFWGPQYISTMSFETKMNEWWIVKIQSKLYHCISTLSQTMRHVTRLYSTHVKRKLQQHFQLNVINVYKYRYIAMVLWDVEGRALCVKPAIALWQPNRKPHNDINANSARWLCHIHPFASIWCALLYVLFL